MGYHCENLIFFCKNSKVGVFSIDFSVENLWGNRTPKKGSIFIFRRTPRQKIEKVVILDPVFEWFLNGN